MLLSLLLESCTQPSVHEPNSVTLTFADQQWVSKQYVEEYQEELRQFTQRTGIRVNFPPSPESTRDQLAFRQELLGTGASGPDHGKLRLHGFTSVQNAGVERCTTQAHLEHQQNQN
jgi:hypothetical protein